MPKPIKFKSNAMGRLRTLLQNAIDSGACTMVQVSARSGIDTGLLYKYLRGERRGLTVLSMERLLDAIGAHPLDVFGEPRKAPDAVVQAARLVLRWAEGK